MLFLQATNLSECLNIRLYRVHLQALTGEHTEAFVRCDASNLIETVAGYAAESGKGWMVRRADEVSDHVHI